MFKEIIVFIASKHNKSPLSDIKCSGWFQIRWYMW